MEQTKFCIIDDRGNHFWVRVSSQTPLEGLFYGKRCLGIQRGDKIWIRDGLTAEKTDEVLRHEIAHPRIPRFKGEFSPLRSRTLPILATLLFLGGPAYYFVFHSGLLGVIAVLAFLAWGLYLVRGRVDSKKHEEAVDKEAKKVTYRIHDHLANHL